MGGPCDYDLLAPNPFDEKASLIGKPKSDVLILSPLPSLGG